MLSNQSEPTVALVSWGDRFEDFFDHIGVSLETFRDEYVNNWMFNYTDALRLVGVRTVLFFFSARISKTLRFTHRVSGATVCVLPTPIIHHPARFIHRAVRKSTRWAWSSEPQGLKVLASYLSTPLRLLADELRREGCKAILCQEYEYARFDTCVLLGKFINLPVFATYQGSNSQISRLEYPLRPLAIRACAGLIISPQTEIERVRACYGVPPAKLARIFTPMDITTWRAIDRNEARAALGIPIDARVVVCHGRIAIGHKGLDILLDAWLQICSERPGRNLRLLLVGTGSDADQFRQLIATMQPQGLLWVDEFVRDRAKIQQYLSAADVYTLASRNEGFPIAPLEAMACGLPVVAADAPGVPDILEDGEASGGLVVPRENATALAQALGRVLDDEAWGRELGKRARRRVEDCFSLEATGKQLRDFLFSQKLPEAGKFEPDRVVKSSQ